MNASDYALILSVIGAGAWLPTISKCFKRSKIECKILKYEWLDNGTLEYQVPFLGGLKKIISGNVYKICARIVSKKTFFTFKFSSKN